MTAVVDASVLVAALVDADSEGRWARSTLATFSPAGPELVLAETTNVLRRLERKREISEFQAAVAHRDLLSLRMSMFPFAPLASRIWQLRDNLTAYDGWYVALAEVLDCPLATLDRRLARAAGSTCRMLIPGSDDA